MDRGLKQTHYVVLFLLMALIAGMVLIENERFIGQAWRGPLASNNREIQPPNALAISAIITANPCPAGSIEITQEDIDLAIGSEKEFVISQSATYCLSEDLIISKRYCSQQ